MCLCMCVGHVPEGVGTCVFGYAFVFWLFSVHHFVVLNRTRTCRGHPMPRENRTWRSRHGISNLWGLQRESRYGQHGVCSY